MKKQLLLNLILVISVLFSTVKAFGYAEVEQAVNTLVQPAVAIEKISSNETGTINPKTGIHGGLSASFNLKTNGTDADYDFIVASKVMTTSGEVSAYTPDGYLLFGNTTVLPTSGAVEEAKTNPKNSRNIIVYPITISITNPMTVSYDNSKDTNEGTGCYVVQVNNANEGILEQNIGSSPYGGSYSIGTDEAGTYKSVVYFTAVSK